MDSNTIIEIRKTIIEDMMNDNQYTKLFETKDKLIDAESAFIDYLMTLNEENITKSMRKTQKSFTQSKECINTIFENVIIENIKSLIGSN